jgi:HEAT repeat protein
MLDCQAQEAQKKMQAMIQQVLEKKPSASEQARQLGRSANPELIKLTRNDDPGVRRVAVYCLDETGGADASVAFARLANDPDSQVRAVALAAMLHHTDDVVPATLWQAYDQSHDGYARQQLVLVAAKVKEISTEEIRKRLAPETDPQVREGIIVALAERDDPTGKTEFIRALQSAKDRDLARYLEHAEDIHAKWLVPALVPVLDDKTPLVRIGVDGIPRLPQHLRACDIAVNLIAKISGHKFSFPIAGNVNYTDEQIAEVKKFAEAA